MYFLFLGDDRFNLGPSNVNKEIICHKSRNVLRVNYGHRLAKFPEAFVKLIASKLVIISGVSKFHSIFAKIAKYMGKKVVYIMHGYAAYEAIVDGREEGDPGIEMEKRLLESADLILSVSKKYAQWFAGNYPKYAAKTGWWQVGIKDISMDMSNVERQKNSVSAAGGDWQLKRNDVLCRAVEKLNGKVHLTVYGAVHDPTVVDRTPYTTWEGRVDHHRFLDGLKGKEIFVVNSAIESFSVAVMEALACGCSILISENAGATGLMELTDGDIIFDTNDLDEIAEKILYLLEHPNNCRIVNSINWHELRYDVAVKHLEEICEQLIKKEKKAFYEEIFG